MKRKNLESEEEVNAFYYNQGINCVIAFVFNVEDLIADNIIACSSKPAFFDLEMLLKPEHKNGKDYWTSSTASRVYNQSVIKTGLLPEFGFETLDSPGYSNAGLSKNMGDTMDTWLVISIAVFTGGLFGWIGYYIYAWALSETGKWLDGKASSEKIRTVIAWSLVPAVVALLLIIPELVILGDDLFKSEMGAYPQLTIYVIYFFGILEIVLSIWSIVILVAGLKVVQSFGFMVAMAFVVSASLFALELKRKEGLGLLKPQVFKTDKNKKQSTDWFSYVLGFLFGYKFIPLITSSCELLDNARDYIFSSDGSIIGGIIVLALAIVYTINK